MERRLDCDVLIVGGGLVGSALAVALAASGCRAVLVESRDPSRLEQPSFDARVTALANGSQRILAALGVWQGLVRDAEPIRTIHVSERGRFGTVRIDARDEGVAALGYTVENRRLGEALWSRLSAARDFVLLGNASLSSFERNDEGVHATIEGAEGAIDVHARLMVAADGARSRVREALGIGAREDRYAQQALIVNVTTDKPHDGVAYERFIVGGPLAMLPLPGGRVGVIWTLPARKAEHVAVLPEGAFRDALQDAFGYRLGRFLKIGTRALHPLRRLRSDALGDGPVVLVGNAAVTLHPVAGQGFNLALRDVAALVDLIADARADADYARIAERYRIWRADDQRKVAWFTHGLIGLFGLSQPGIGALRGLGLAAFDLLPGAKTLLARHTMGIAGKLPRLARGLSPSGGTS